MHVNVEKQSAISYRRWITLAGQCLIWNNQVVYKSWFIFSIRDTDVRGGGGATECDIIKTRTKPSAKHPDACHGQ